MVLFNYATKELTAKVVYYGPGLCGKTTNLQYIYDSLPTKAKGKMLSLATKTDRTLFFDFLPIDLGTIRGMKTKIQLYTVPGQVFYDTTRKLVLKGADGVVFVADSQRAMVDANLDSFENLIVNLKEQNLDIKSMPYVIQFNKRDMKNVVPVEELNQRLNKEGVPHFEAVAPKGEGVFETLKGISKLVLKNLGKKYGLEEDRGDDSLSKSSAGRNVSPPTPPPKPQVTRPGMPPAVSAARGAAPVRPAPPQPIETPPPPRQPIVERPAPPAPRPETIARPPAPAAARRVTGVASAVSVPPPPARPAPPSRVNPFEVEPDPGLDEIEFIDDDQDDFDGMDAVDSLPDDDEVIEFDEVPTGPTSPMAGPAAAARSARFSESGPLDHSLEPIPSLDNSEVIELDDVDPLEIEELDDMAEIAHMASDGEGGEPLTAESVAIAPIEVPVSINLPASLEGKPLRLQIDIVFEN